MRLLVTFPAPSSISYIPVTPSCIPPRAEYGNPSLALILSRGANEIRDAGKKAGGSVSSLDPSAMNMSLSEMSSARLGRFRTFDAGTTLNEATDDREVEEGELSEALRLDEEADEEHDGVPMSMPSQLRPSNGAATRVGALRASTAWIWSIVGTAVILSRLIAVWR
jgi:hypothetical protein